MAWTLGSWQLWVVGRAKAEAENRATETARAMLRMEGIMDGWVEV